MRLEKTMNTLIEKNTLTEIKVWDPFVRLFHWTLVAAFFTAYFTEDDLQTVHVWAGYTVFGLLVLRLIWGLVGTPHARFSDFIYSPRRVLIYIGEVLTGKAVRYIGHNPAGGMMIMLLLLSLLVTTVSGVLLFGADQWQGPLGGVMQNTSEHWIDLFEETHEFFANFTLFLVAIHVIGVIWESLLHQENLLRAMFNGRKRA
jgi:cytochrome b